MKPEQRRSVSYSQNFLTSPALARRIIDTASIDARDLVIEIGPGKGILTRELARRCRHVLAIEKDPRLARRLGRSLQPHDNVVVFEADLLELPLPLTPFKVFANIPFNVTAAIVNRLTEAANPPDEASLVMQREAAERFSGEPRETMTSLRIKPWFQLSFAHWFARDDFVPPPRVDVVLLRFSKRGPPLVPDAERQLYRDFVTHGFTAWQPTVADAYRNVFSRRQLAVLAGDTGLDLDRKPSQMPFDRWLAFYQLFARYGTSRQRTVIDGAESRIHEQQQRIEKTHRTRSRG